MINPMDLLKLKKMWDRFREEHPRLVPFAKEIRDGYLKEGTLFELKVTDEEGNVLSGDFRLSAREVALFADLMDVVQGNR